MRSKGFFLLSLLVVPLLVISPTVAYGKPGRGQKGGDEIPIAIQNLIESPDGRAAAWDNATITILIDPNVYSPDSPEISAGRRAIDHWKASITWFSTQDWDGDDVSDYSWLDSLEFIVYVHGVNETLLTSSADVTITYYYRISRYILGYASLSYKEVYGHYAIQSVEILVGVKGLGPIGIENIVAHEFGHALGLGHSNKKGDLMYSVFDMKDRYVVAPQSTLNLYALTTSHGWLETGIFLEHHGRLAIILPAYIPYQKVP